MTVIFQPWIVRADLRARPDVLFLYGDNELREGFGGQAKEMRGEPNAQGVRTKRLPTMDDDAFWTDENLAANVRMIHMDLTRAYRHVMNRGTLVIPERGLGTGYSEMPERCPLTLEYLDGCILRLANQKWTRS